MHTLKQYFCLSPVILVRKFSQVSTSLKFLWNTLSPTHGKPLALHFLCYRNFSSPMFLAVLSKLGLVRKSFKAENKFYLIRLKYLGWWSLLSFSCNKMWLFSWSCDMYLHSWSVCIFWQLRGVGFCNFPLFLIIGQCGTMSSPKGLPAQQP